MYPLLPKKKIAWVMPHPGKGSGGTQNNNSKCKCINKSRI